MRGAPPARARSRAGRPAQALEARGRSIARDDAVASGREERAARVRCPHFPSCVGCPLVGTLYGEQLRAKERDLRDALRAFPSLGALAPERIAGSPSPFGYRNHARLVLRRRRAQGGPSEVVLGVYRPGTHSVMPAERCAVHDPGLRRLLVALREEVEALAIPIFDERTRTGLLRYALARRSRWQRAIHLTLVSAAAAVPALDRLLDRLRRAEPELESAFLCVNPTPGNALLSSDIRKLFGPRALVERFGRLVLESRPDAFVQANVEVATRIYATAEQWLDPQPEDVVVDLYGGVGGIGLALAPRLARVLGIESSAAAVECANANAKRAHHRHVRYVTAAAEDAATIAAREALAPAAGGATIAVVNPPRRGLTDAARRAVCDLAPRSILYLSCNPATLARDLAVLVERGYAVRRVRPFDMLPQTPHLEVLALLDAAPASGASR
ncbi:MAG TPA: 23S rRNA (uracil(1939)-C(5))-methyltransferase RlmD [Candidatus Binatia bacterium]|nr:23S rRNA (uracil(1939)-C(5))-methyltransferase RlmD [Candidatus Binatia bacterium]